MTIEEFVQKFPEHEEEVIERASILEYHAGYQKEDAEIKAMIIIRQKYNLKEEGEFDF